MAGRQVMRRGMAGLLLGFAAASPAAAQAPNVQQFLQGLTTGNQSQDRALQDAFERGYQRGREDESRQRRGDRTGADRQGSYDDRSSGGGYNNDRPRPPYNGSGSYNGSGRSDR